MLTVKNLTTAYTGPIDVTVDTGQCVTVMGASGSGKSLMLRAIADLDINEGDVLLDNRNRNDMPADEWRRLVALVPAESGWWADRVGDHFLNRESTSKLLDRIGMPDAFDWDISRLSTGERHRLALVRAMELQPRALLLDEPTAALDDEATEVVESLLRGQLEQGVSILLVTHDAKQGERIGGQSFVMKNGTLHTLEQNMS